MRTKRKPSRSALVMSVCASMFLASCASDRPALEAQPLYSFQDAAAAPDVHGDDSRTWGSAWHDFDLDGDADLLAGRHWRPAQLYVNAGRRLRNVNPGSRTLEGGDRHGCAWGEANGDGLPDLYCVQGADKGTGTGPNQLFVQTTEGFEESASRFHAVDRFGRGRTTNWIDLDGDDDLDLFVGNHWRDGYPNQTLRNDGDRFTRVSIGLTEELSTVGSSWADWDRDGDFDMLLHQLEPKPTIVYENQGGSFERIEIPHVSGGDWSAGAWGDYNGDGWPDLHLVSRTRSLILRNDEGTFAVQHEMRLNEGRMSNWMDADNDGDLDLYVLQGARSENYQPVAGAKDHRDFLILRTRGGFIAPVRTQGTPEGRGNGDSIAVSDYDRDGRVDVFVTNGYFHSRGVHQLLENGSRTAGWIGLDLIGPPTNPQGIGAQIRIRTATRRYWRQTNDGVNFRSQSEVGYVHVGIAANPSARIMVVWPDGTRDCVRALRNSVRRVEIGDAPCRAGR